MVRSRVDIAALLVPDVIAKLKDRDGTEGDVAAIQAAIKKITEAMVKRQYGGIHNQKLCDEIQRLVESQLIEEDHSRPATVARVHSLREAKTS